MTIDVESLLDRLKTFLVANLNSHISALNAEKNDGITLKTVDDAAYHLQYPQDRTELHDPFVVYEEAADPRFDVKGPLIGVTYHLGVWIILADNGMDLDIQKRLFRYRKALVNLVKANWDTIVMGYKFSLSAWMPTEPFQTMNNREWTGRAVGIQLTVSLTD